MPGARFTDIRHFDTIDSTNRYLLDEARAGAPDGVVAVAEHQSAGRGRLGRRWEATGRHQPAGVDPAPSGPAGPTTPPGQCRGGPGRGRGRRVGGRPPAWGSNGRTTCWVGTVGRWPECWPRATWPRAPGSGSGGAPAIVVGIGINVNWPASDEDLPDELVGTATSLSQLAGHPVDRSEVLDALLEALEPRLVDLGTVAGRARQADDLRRPLHHDRHAGPDRAGRLGIPRAPPST